MRFFYLIIGCMISLAFPAFVTVAAVIFSALVVLRALDRRKATRTFEAAVAEESSILAIGKAFK